MEIENYILRNNKATYYRVKNNCKVEYIEPSFVFEMIYFKNEKMLEKELSNVVIEKDKKINRCANLSIEEIEERLFRSLVNRDKYHSVSLAHELYLRNSEKLLDILYKLSFLSEDENKLIKTYLFDMITSKTSYNKYMLKNLIIYFIKSSPKYMDMDDLSQLEYFEKNVSKLYYIVYNINDSKREKMGIKKLNLKPIDKISEIKEYIYYEIKENGLC